MVPRPVRGLLFITLALVLVIPPAIAGRGGRGGGGRGGGGGGFRGGGGGGGFRGGGGGGGIRVVEAGFAWRRGASLVAQR